jgi:glycogen synthase
MEKGYVELQAGATFGIMPSIYEPFGAAIEYMVHGTPNIVRRTGGLVDQVSHGENGSSYRERSDAFDLRRIRHFVTAAAHVESRKSNQWAVDMADALEATLRDAIALYRQQPAEYYAAILRGFAKARSFSWEENAAEYSGLYDAIAVV